VNAGYATIITPIICGTCREKQAEEVKRILRTEVEPLYDPAEILKCKPRFPFDKIESLHFCSFTVLDDDGEFPPYLVFEATFDGSRDIFLDALLNVAGCAIDKVYRYCEDYPVSGLAVPELIKEYLVRYDYGAQTFFRGSPGRTVAQIKGEAQICDALSNSVCRPWSRPKAMPATFAGLQEELQHDVIRKQLGNRWAEQMAAVPWEVAGRGAMATAAVAAVAVLAWALGALVLGLCGQGASHVDEGWRRLVGQLGNWLSDPTGLNWLNALGSKLHLPIVLPLFALLVVWALLRFVELILQFEDPRRTSFWIRFLVHILIISRYMVLVLFIGYATLSLDPKLSPESGLTAWRPRSFDPAPYPILLLIGAGFVFLLFQHWATSLKLSVQFEELKWWKENFRRLEIDSLRTGMILIAVFAVYVISSRVPAEIKSALGQILFPPIRVSLVLAVYLFVGVIIAYIIAGVLFQIVKVMERADRRRFSSGEGLTAFGPLSVYAREEVGINTYQNHLVSLTYVKPGFLRRWFLRLTLFFIGLLSRFWFNIGELGGIPTILSARWLLIDGGNRLLFLDHYGGAWDSYLNEFIDMGAVIGLNGIWTNTFVKAREAEYAFPETEYYFWKGAQAERPFKAYVRQSQIETIVWYSAYPVPATFNINTNTDVRQSLFKPLASCEIDLFLQNL
jgi:uncharacterized membrane protein YciS (DUF1049 family)